MKKILLFATALCLSVSATAAENAGTVKQTTIRYNVPTCENCKTTTYKEVVRPQPVMPVRPIAQPVAKPCTTCGAPYARPAGMPCVDNNDLGITNPLFFVKPGQTSSESIVSLWKQPKGAYKEDGEKSGEIRGYDVAERIYAGLYDRLALHLEAGFAFQAPKTEQFKADVGSPVPHHSSYDGTVGLTYHLIDTCIFDMMVGVDGTWGRAVLKYGDEKDGVNFTVVTPNVMMGFRLGYLTPYLRASYDFAHSKDHDLNIDSYRLIPGLYFQPNKYFAVNASLDKIKHKKKPRNGEHKDQYTIGLDVFPYKNVAIGAEATLVKPFNHPMYTFGGSGHVKILF